MSGSPHSIPKIEVRGLDMAYGETVIMRNLNLTIARGEIAVIIGASGCGKSTLLKYLIGLKQPTRGEIVYDGQSFSNTDSETQSAVMRRFGVLYQNGALWSAMTLRENVALPIEMYTHLKRKEVDEIASLKLALVGLKGCEALYPSQISGGMRKRAALARAMALDPEVFFFDEPSAGLDPFSSSRLDDLILQLRDSLGATVVIVSHELASIFAIADRAFFLDVETRALIAEGPPQMLRDHATVPRVRHFLRREPCM